MSEGLVPKFTGDLSEMLLKNGDSCRSKKDKFGALKAYRLAGLSESEALNRYNS